MPRQAILHVLITVMIASFLNNCAPKSRVPITGEAAEVIVYDIERDGYDLKQFRLQDADSGIVTDVTVLGHDDIKVNTNSGTYFAQLDYLQDGKIIYSSDFCQDVLMSQKFYIQAGLNQINVMVCDEEEIPVSEVMVPDVSDQSKTEALELWGRSDPRIEESIINLRDTQPQDAALLSWLNKQAKAKWFGEWSGEIEAAVQNYVTQVADPEKYPILVAFNIPLRDCNGQESAGGVATYTEYKEWIQGFARGIRDRKVIVILEPDALADSISQAESCQGINQDERLKLLQDAVKILKMNPQTKVYLDAGHPQWLNPETAAKLLNQAGIAFADGFSLNVSNYQTTPSNISYGNLVSELVGGKPFVIDTSRNGQGSPPDNEWCNPSGRGIGRLPSGQTGHERLDAFLWVKRPGESDGVCNEGPAAGEWWLEMALELLKNAESGMVP
ncbi:MAG: glycoside hydrolase family 6 protein [Oligoflexus sp.]